MHRATGLSLVFVAALATSALAADAHKGETLAKRWCAACHVWRRINKWALRNRPHFQASPVSQTSPRQRSRYFCWTHTPNAGYEFIAKRSGRFSGLYQNAEITQLMR